MGNSLVYCHDLAILHATLMQTENADHFKEGLIGLVDIVQTMKRNHEMMAKQIDDMQDEITGLKKELTELKGQVKHAANVASCLANGIQPD